MTREYCVVTHTRRSEWNLIWREGFATRVVGPLSKLVNPQHGSPYTRRGTAPQKKKAMRKLKSGKSRRSHQTNSHTIGSTPSLISPIALKAPSDKSMELAFSQVGHSSATVTVMLFPFAVLVMCTDFPQMLWLYSAESLTRVSFIEWASRRNTHRWHKSGRYPDVRCHKHRPCHSE